MVGLDENMSQAPHIGSMRLALLLGLLLAGCRAPLVPYAARARQVMGSVFTVGAWGADSARLSRAVLAAADSATTVDSLLSLEHDSSELSRLNRRVGQGPQRVSARLATVLNAALDVARRSDGAFDPTGKNYRGVTLDTVRGTVRLGAGLTLDLSGIATGYALDRSLAALRGVADSAILSLEGVQVVMRGERLSRPGRHIGITDPGNALARLAELELPPGTWAIGTASVADADPIQDPRTGRPTDRSRSVTIIGREAVTASAWSRAFFVLGCDRALEQASQVGVGVICTDHETRWTRDLDGRVTLLTDSAQAAGTAPAPAPGRAPAPAPAAHGSTMPSVHSGSSLRDPRAS